MNQSIPDVRSLISRLGGDERDAVKKVATALEVLTGRSLTVASIYLWQEKDEVTAPWRDTLRAMAKFRGLELPPSLEAPSLEDA